MVTAQQKIIVWEFCWEYKYACGLDHALSLIASPKTSEGLINSIMDPPLFVS